MSLLESIRSGDVAQALRQVAAGADANELGEGGETALMAAASAGHVELVRELLKRGAEPALVDASGETALMRGAANGHRRVFELLAPHASPDDRDAAKAYLDASGGTDGPASEGPSKVRVGAVDVAARAAKFFGHQDAARRVERVERAEKHRKK